MGCRIKFTLVEFILGWGKVNASKGNTGAMVELLPYSASDPGSTLSADSGCMEFFGWSPCDSMGFLQVLRFPPSLERHASLKVNWLL